MANSHHCFQTSVLRPCMQCSVGKGRSQVPFAEVKEETAKRAGDMKQMVPGSFLSNADLNNCQSQKGKCAKAQKLKSSKAPT
ncbi:hypothetical protein CDN98_20000 [Roseateles terrae]|uniref:Uncharacterized protein n=1 Tax=Roseateles terrae TaxID=431060 RepID=A0ABR6GYB4_9BURK|nr:hypothetical protein [Roseateles terrae]OWQ84261.1 hypothetical protein CDN98_20000 [Roseateles terrae]